MTSFLLKTIFLNGRKKVILPVLYVMTNHKHWSMSSAPVRQLLEIGDTPRGITVLEELVKFIKNYMKSEPTISTQKFVSERGRIYAGSKQTIKHQAVPGQNLLGSSGHWEVSADLPRMA